ncbi:MAG: ornithine cyclodeaminase [Pseudomonadales bacterium]|nr:ornithine cyclodeaminase [Pseudomonadales bacterium]
MKIITALDIKKLLHNIGLKTFMRQCRQQMEADFKQWQSFDKSPRHAVYHANGVIELMPTANQRRYSMKYVNGHPNNPQHDLLSVIALGLLADMETGYPLFLTDMTLLTAIRTAALTALAAKYLAKNNSHTLAMIGCGAQSEFQILACCDVLPIQQIYCFDPDTQAMQKLQTNLQSLKIPIYAASNIDKAITNADMIITATAKQGRHALLHLNNVKAGTHIHALGGDSPGKTEIAFNLLKQCRIVVEYLPQTRHEGEIQDNTQLNIDAELWQLIQGLKTGRSDDQQITLFDAVGFALEDFSVLTVLEKLLETHNVGQELAIFPEIANPKDLYGFLQ